MKFLCGMFICTFVMGNLPEFETMCRTIAAQCVLKGRPIGMFYEGFKISLIEQEK